MRTTLFLCLIFSYHIISGFLIVEGKPHKLKQNSDIIQLPGGFVKTESGYFILNDLKAGNLKIFNSKGDWVKNFGRKGFGPDEFKDAFLHDCEDNTILINNRGTHELFLYKVDKKGDDITLEKKTSMRGNCVDAKLENNKILVTKFPKFGNNQKTLYSLFAMNPETKKTEDLFPSELQFGPKPVEIRRFQGREIQDELTLGLFTFCDAVGDDIYFAWQGKASIMKMKMPVKGPVTPDHIDRFGQKSRNYLQPKASRELKKAYAERDIKKIRKIQKSMSWVSEIIADKEFIGIAFERFDEKTEYWNAFLQLYAADGTFKGEFKLKGLKSYFKFIPFFYSKKNKTLYGLSRTLDKNDNDSYEIHSYKIKT